jgi:hypothetical protein
MRIRKTLRVTPAMAAGLTERLAIMDAHAEPQKRGPHKKQALAW